MRFTQQRTSNKVTGRHRAQKMNTHKTTTNPEKTVGIVNGFEFDAKRVDDSTYITQWALGEAKRKNATIRRNIHKGCTVFGVVDLIYVFGEYNNRETAAKVWGWLLPHLPKLSIITHTHTINGNQIHHCRIMDFITDVIPHITGMTAGVIRRARSTTTKKTSKIVDTFDGLQNTKHTSGTEMSGDEANKTDNIFDCRRANDMTYLAQWVQDEAKRKNTLVRQQGTKHLGVVDLMYIFGDYNNRETASTQWRKLKAKSVTRPSGSGPESRGFYVSYEFQGKPMDHCTISDFLDHVLPHITGRTADILRRARSATATLVSTGSQMAIDLTNHNAQSIQNAPKEIANVVENTRQETETTAMEMVPEEVAEYQITEREWQQEHPHRVEYTNPIRGHVFYVRKSLAHFVTNVAPPPSSPLQLNVGKLGKTSDIVSRHTSYGKDFGVFINAIVFESRDDVDHFERIMKSLIHKDRSSGTEYFDENEVSTRYKQNNTWELYEEKARDLMGNSILGMYGTKITVTVDREETTQPKLTHFFECTQNGVKPRTQPTIKVSVTFTQTEGERRVERSKSGGGALELQLSNNTVQISRYAYEMKKIEVDAQVELKRLDLELKRAEHDLELKRLELESKKVAADVQMKEIDGKTQVEIKSEEFKNETTKRGLELNHEEQLKEYELRKLQMTLEMETVRLGRHGALGLTDKEKTDFLSFWETCTIPSTRSVLCRTLLERYQQYTRGNALMRITDFNRLLKAIGVRVKRSVWNKGNGVECRVPV